MRAAIRSATKIATPLALGLAASMWHRQYKDRIHASNEFSRHLAAQQNRRPFSGMASPFISQDPENQKFLQRFPQFQHLMLDVETLKNQEISTPIYIKPMSACPVQLPLSNAIVGMGGFGGLIPCAYLLEQAKAAGIPVLMIADKRKGRAVSDGYACDIEEDSDAEAKTSKNPFEFILEDLIATFWNPPSMRVAEETGFISSWRNIDKMAYVSAVFNGYVLAPFRAVYLAYGLQRSQAETDREQEFRDIAQKCWQSKQMYLELNKRMGGKLFTANYSVMVARNEAEKKDLLDLQAHLKKVDGIYIEVLTPAEAKAKGLVAMDIAGVAMALKPDLVMAANHVKLLTDYIAENGGQAIDGVVTDIYGDKDNNHGVVAYQTADGQKHYVACNLAYASFGHQQVFDQENKPLHNLVAAQGISGHLRLRLPADQKLPRILFPNGIAARLIHLGEPVLVEVDGKKYYDYLTRVTFGATVRPEWQAIPPAERADFDRVMAMAVVTSLKKMTNATEVSVINMKGCARPYSKNGEIAVNSPFSWIHLSWGQGGGGGTRAFEPLSRKDPSSVFAM